MPRPESYRVQDGCWNCALCFQPSYGEQFCLKGSQVRPMCPKDVSEYNLYYTKHSKSPDVPVYYLFDQWARGRSVIPAGICDEWEKRDDT